MFNALTALMVLTLTTLIAACQPTGPVFDSAAWRASRPALQPSGNPRLAMADALVAQHLPAGMKRQAVRELLGPPDYQQAGRDLWDLGFAPMRMDMSSLVVDYDAADALRQARVQLN